MAQLRIRGQTATQTSQATLTERFGRTLVLLIERARETGVLDDRVDRMLAWLVTNRGHPKWSEREARYWRVVGRRNEAVTAMADLGDELGALHRQMSEELVTDVNAVFGGETTPLIGQQVAVLIRQHPGERGLMFLDRWVREHALNRPNGGA